MLEALQNGSYRFVGYDDWAIDSRSVIMRHDIDFDPVRALRIAQIEREAGAKASYFFLLRSDFYNACAPSVLSVMDNLLEMGHSVGLHFDEAAYDEGSDIAVCVQNEIAIMEAALGVSGKGLINTVSMHRPSKAVLEGDISIPGVINTYSSLFLEEFKYLSDSRCHWRIQPIPVITSGRYSRLHILTHPFWYHETDRSIKESLAAFINDAVPSRVLSICENVRNVGEELDGECLLNARIAEASKASHETERISLRPLRMSDAHDMYEYACNEEICRFLRWGPYRHIEEAEAWLNMKLGDERGRDLLFGIELRNVKKLIGVVRAYNFDVKKGKFEISYVLNGAFQGHGYAMEAVQRLLDLCFERLDMTTGNAYVDKDNHASRSLLLKLGFVRSQDRPRDLVIKGRIRPHEHYIVEREF